MDQRIADKLIAGLVPEGDCLVWSLGKQEGYGVLTVDYKDYLTHRVAYELENGPIPDGLQVRHTCDNPPCCKGSHLLIGTAKDNAQDRVERNRGARGERHGMALVDEKTVLAVIDKYNTGNYSQRALAKEFGISQSSVHNFVAGKSWKHI